MALPLIAAGIVARAVAKKLATRAVGGITGAGAKNVAPINREMGTGSVKVRNLKGEAKELSEFTGDKINAKTYKNIVNEGNTSEAVMTKSGEAAKALAAYRTMQNKSILKKPTVKINSGNTRAR